MDSSLDIQAIQLPALQYQHERRTNDWAAEESCSMSDCTEDSGTLITEDCSSIKLNGGVRKLDADHCLVFHKDYLLQSLDNY